MPDGVLPPPGPPYRHPVEFWWALLAIMVYGYCLPIVWPRIAPYATRLWAAFNDFLWLEYRR